MGDCCSTATITPVVFVVLSIISLRYDSVDNRISFVFEANAEHVSVSWTKDGVTISETDPFFVQTLDRHIQSGTSDTYTYTAALVARVSNRPQSQFSGTFECITTYNGKRKRRTITLSAPPVPLNLRVIDTTATSVTIAWDPPLFDDRNGNTIVAYRIAYGTVSHNVPATQRRYVANSLHPNTLYQFAVFATTVVEGNSATIEVTTQEAAPSAPSNILVFNTSSTSLRVEWSPPVTPNGIIRGYRITYYKSASADTPPAVMTHDVTGNVTSYELTDLEIFTTYSITIQGRTIVLGNTSSIVNATTEEDAPSPPTGVQAVNTSSTSLRVEWNPPVTSNGIIRGYRITYFSTDDPTVVMTHDVAGSETSYELTDLDIFTTYSIYIQGRTIMLGNASTIVNATTEEDAPSPPTTVQAFNTSSTSLRVEWSPPATPNGIIRGYRITYYKSASTDTPPAVMTHDVTGNVASYELTDLDIFTTYSISIQGRTIMLGNASSIVNATTEEDAPSPPTAVLAVNTSSTSLRVEWNLPTTANGIVRGYRITYYPLTFIDNQLNNMLTQDVAGNETWFELTNLEIYTTYSIFIQAQTIIFGEPSSTVNATTDEDVPSAPINVKATALNSTSIQILWSQPISPNGELVHYTLYYRLKQSAVQEWQTLTVPVDVTTVSFSSYMYNLTGLLEYEQYQIAVTASTRIGESVASLPVVVTTDPESSDPPTAVSAVPINSSTIRLSWGFPNVPRGIIRGYIVTYSSIVQDNNASFIHNITLSSINDMRNQTALLGVLETFTCYWFAVAAYAISEPDDAFQIHRGLVSQPVMGCTFDEDVWFQLLITDLGKQSCDQWIEQDATEKLKDVMAAIVSNVQAHCLCGFTENYLRSGFFKCFPSSKTTVTYRGVINGFGNTSSDDLIQNIKQWISKNVTIPIQAILRPVDNMCNVRIPSRDAEECVSETNGLPATIPGQYRLVGLVVGLVIGCIVIAVVSSAIMVIVGVYWIRRTPKHSEHEQSTPENHEHEHDQHSVDNAPPLPEKETPDEEEQDSDIKVQDDEMKIEDIENFDDDY